MQNETTVTSAREEPQQLALAKGQGRRGFLRMLAGGAGLATAVTASGCDLTNIGEGGGDNETPRARTVELGSGDVGVLNYALTLEALEAAFYIQVVNNMFSGASNDEMRVLRKLRNHEIIHRNFLRTALGESAVRGLEFDFSSVDFSSRTSVLTTARVFEDTGVAAYNGAGQLLMSPDFLTVAGKIVSVEARHASSIRDLIQPRSRFSVGEDVVNEMGLDRALPPSEILPMVAPFIKNRIIASQLPTA